MLDGFGVGFELGAVAAAEFAPALRFMPEPLSQGRARGDFLEPERQRR